MPKSGRTIKRPVSEEDIRKWEEGWSEMMITIWREKILQLAIIDTQQLYNRMSHVVSQVPGVTVVTHEFMKYGLFMEAGVGNGYSHGNGGDLEILNPYTRRERGLDKPRKRGPKSSTKNMTSGKPRKRRVWFSKRYISSINVLTQVERDLYGNQYMGTMSNVVRMMFDLHNEFDNGKTNPLRSL